MAVATYKGYSTLVNKFGGVGITDTDLIKQDLLNHLGIRKGEKLMNGNFGTSINDMIMEPLTEESKQMIVQEITTVMQNDPRVVAESIVLDEFEAGLQVELVVRYVLTNQVENLIVRFDRSTEEQL